MKKQMVWFVILIAVIVGCDQWPPERPGDAPGPTADGKVTGPVTGGTKGGPFTSAQVDLQPYDYVEEEFFLEGQATAYEPEGELGLDGKWNIVPTKKAPYKTRLLVRRPTDSNRFNGTVIVEWLNVTGGIDADVGFIYSWAELLRGGYGYVGVSVQKAGVTGADDRAAARRSGDGPAPLTIWDPERYSSLHHPGDLYCYDIYSQAGAAIAHPDEVDPMQGLKVERLIAYGQSQSAMRMITYVDAVHPLADVFDGFFIQSRAGWGAAVGSESDPMRGNGKPVRVRDDIDAYVLQFLTESEIFLPLGPAFAARQPDNDHLRTWEVAGTAHMDQFLMSNVGDASQEGGLPGCGTGGLLPGCGRSGGSINSGPSHIVVKAGIRAMHLWLKEGTAPSKGEPLAVNTEQNGIARDSYGNALGGIRTPAVDVPIATLNGKNKTQGELMTTLSMMAGKTIPFTSSQLIELYPSHQDYVDKVTASARAAREAGFILPEEEEALIAEAMRAPIPQ